MPSHYPGRPKEVRALSAYITLTRASETLDALLELGLAKNGLRSTQFGILEALRHLGPLSQVELGKKLLRSGGNITLVVDHLEKRKLVRRERQKDDRRVIRVHLTPGGRRLISSLFPAHATSITRMMSCLSAAQQKELRGLCRKLGRGAREKFQSKGDSND